MKWTKENLIAEIADGSERVTRREVKEVLESLEQLVARDLCAGEKVVIPGIVKLTPTRQPSRPGRNPQTRAPITIPERVAIKTKVPPALVKLCNSPAGEG